MEVMGLNHSMTRELSLIITTLTLLAHAQAIYAKVIAQLTEKIDQSTQVLYLEN